MALPSAGWYDDPEAPGSRRYWDGRIWTGDRHPPAFARPSPLTPLPPLDAGPVCPVCGRDDVLRNVGALVDEGTAPLLADRFRMPARPRTRFGSWFLLGWLVPALLLGVLAGPGFVPGAETAGLPAAWVITVSILVTFAFALAVTWIIGLIVAFVQRAAGASSLRARRAQWNAGYWRLRGAYFCARDGVATDGVVAQPPEEFVRFAFGG